MMADMEPGDRSPVPTAPTAPTAPASPTAPADRRVADIDVVLPVRNEEATLERSVTELRRYLDTDFPFRAVITIADNGSTDRTPQIGAALADRVPGVRMLRIDEPGRGRALRAAWTASDSPVVAYMDADLSTGLDALLPLVAPLLSGHSDVAIGTRLARGAHVVRGPRREVISRGYNLIVRSVLHNRFSDAQCGFKAARRDVARELVPLVEDDGWFFDTELLVLAERNGFRIHEVPVDWVDDPRSSVHVTRTALDDLRGIARLVRRLASGGGRTSGRPTDRRPVSNRELARFAGVGVVSTLVYLALFVGLQPVLGTYLANAVALVLCTLGNTVVHARFTFGVRGTFRVRDEVVGVTAVALVSIALTSIALAVVAALAPGNVWAQVLGVSVACAVAAFLRFVVLLAWIFRSGRRHDAVPGTSSSPATAP